MKRIILASTSPRRKDLLEKAGFSFKVEPSDYEEDMSLSVEPRKLVKKLSERKALAVAKKHKQEDVLIIGADTFLVFKNKLFGKPHDIKGAERMIRSLSGKWHSVFSGFTIINPKTGKKVSKAIESRVLFRKLTDKEIRWYVKHENCLDKAGAYAIQGMGVFLIEKIEGDYVGIIGLPMASLIRELNNFR
jgi:septum formation protein